MSHACRPFLNVLPLPRSAGRLSCGFCCPRRPFGRSQLPCRPVCPPSNLSASLMITYVASWPAVEMPDIGSRFLSLTITLDRHPPHFAIHLHGTGDAQPDPVKLLRKIGQRVAL